MNDKQREILTHSLGISGRKKKAYRNHFCAAIGSPDEAACITCVDAGWMRAGRTINTDTARYYLVTDAGAAAVGSKLPDEAD